MSLGMLFWIIYLFCLVFGGIGIFRAPAESRWYGGGFSLAAFILFGLLGWKVFGFIITN